MALLNKMAERLPSCYQIKLKRILYERQIRKSTFKTEEPEYKILENFLTAGDWVIDIGANVGHYTKRFSDLVGPTGRVIAFEPVPTTFSLLSVNVQLFTYPNVTLLNTAVSDKVTAVGMTIPNFSSGVSNYYQAHLSSAADSALSVLTLSIDSVFTNHPIALVKVDVEGHESSVLAGMRKLLEKYFPILIIETDSEDVINNLVSMGYVMEKLENSPNFIFRRNLI